MASSGLLTPWPRGTPAPSPSADRFVADVRPVVRARQTPSTPWMNQVSALRGCATKGRRALVVIAFAWIASTVLLLPISHAQAQQPEPGIATDKVPTDFPTFTHPYGAALGKATKHLRLVSDYNAHPGSGEFARVASIINSAPAGTDIAVTFRKPLNASSVPTPQQYRDGINVLISQFGSRVSYWGVFNEPNIVNVTPEQAKDYYQELVAALGGSNRILGPDVIDRWSSAYPNVFRNDVPAASVTNWISSYIELGGGLGVAATFHPYGAISRQKDTSVKQYANALPAGTPIWLTEAGALRASSHAGPITVDGHLVDDALQAEQVTFLMRNLLGSSFAGRVVTRAYYYQPGYDLTWDTSLFDISQQPRPAWSAFCAYACSDIDGDQLLDYLDRCPTVPGPASLQGCPDSDGDGIADIDDHCPTQSGPAATNGCPDADGDGVRDADDVCPQLPGLAAYNGCLPTGSQAYTDADGTAYVYYRGTDNAIWQLQHQLHAPTWDNVRLGGTAAGNPSAFVDSAGTHYAYYRGTDNAIWQLQHQLHAPTWDNVRLGGTAAG